MKKFINSFIIFILILPLQSQVINRYGTTSANFLEIGVGSDGSAMGEAFVAVTDGISSIYWNPAGLASLEKSTVAFMMHPWVVDINMPFTVSSFRKIFPYIAPSLKVTNDMCDQNGHMNVAYYLQAFDVNSRDLFEEIGFDGDYFQSGYSCFAIEDSLRYQREFLEGDEIRSMFRIHDFNDLDFVELLRIEDGIIREQVTKTDYNIFKDELARRTYDESGDYYIKPFNIDVRESLNDRISNRGVYSSVQTTQNGNTPSDDIISLQISPGKAYVRGYDIEKISTSSVDIVKPRTS